MTTYVYPTKAMKPTKQKLTRKASPAECRQRKSLIRERLRIKLRVPTNRSGWRLLNGRGKLVKTRNFSASTVPSSAFGTFSPAESAGEKALDVTQCSRLTRAIERREERGKAPARQHLR